MSTPRPFRGATRHPAAPRALDPRVQRVTTGALQEFARKPCRGCGKGKTPEQDLADLFSTELEDARVAHAVTEED